MTELCRGAEGGKGEPICNGLDVRDVAFLAPTVTNDPKWERTRWCVDCRMIAKHDGYEVITWTDHVGHCSRGCGKRFRVSQESIDDAKGQYNDNVEETVASFDFCLGCVAGDEFPGEYDIPNAPGTHEHDGHFQLTNLTARDIFAIHAALEVACDDEDEPYPGLNDALAKVEKVVKGLRAAGAEPPSPETSVQSQAFIDGASPWPFVETSTEDTNVIENRCEFCGEFESECVCDEESEFDGNPHGSDQSCTVDEDDDDQLPSIKDLSTPEENYPGEVAESHIEETRRFPEGK